ncbi:hypothetical protein BN961_03633 [Afipia felis]|uniref:Uncharacterized protein n=1 Tax=Afipia felis TaxID=1035 RepID=A0A090MS85_AFIFE|nr:hypothetical protein BN961_03633 [Afipia felis]
MHAGCSLVGVQGVRSQNPDAGTKHSGRIDRPDDPRANEGYASQPNGPVYRGLSRQYVSDFLQAGVSIRPPTLVIQLELLGFGRPRSQGHLLT